MRFKIYDLSNAANQKAVKRGPAFVEVSSTGRICFSKEAARLLGLSPDRKAGVTFGTDDEYPMDWYVFASEDKKAFPLRWAKNGRPSVTSNVLAALIQKDAGVSAGSVRFSLADNKAAGGLALAIKQPKPARGGDEE